MSPIVALIVLLVLVGICLYLIPMDESIKGLVIKITTVVAVILVIIWLLQVLGVSLPNLGGRIR